MNKFQTVLSACLLSGLTAQGQARLSPYAANALRTHTATTIKAAPEYAGGSIRAYIYMDKDTDRKILAELGVKLNLDLGHIATAQVPISSIKQLSLAKGVKYITTGHAIQPMMDKARPTVGADMMLAGTSLPQAYNGSGVVVGIIDAGFDYTHPAFRDATRTKLRIKRVWEQGTQTTTIAGASTPTPFGYGTEFDTDSEILAACTDREGNSHGTHVAGIAAGGDTASPYHGIATNSDIVLVSYGDLQDNNVNISDAIAYIYSYAKAEGKPCVINMSLGTQMGPHDGTSTFDSMADLLQGEGCLLIGSAGNFGAVPLHASATDQPLLTTIKYAKAPSNSNVGGDIDIWGEEGNAFSIRVAVLNKSTGEIVCQSDEYTTTADGTYQFTPASPTRGDITVSTETNPLNGKPHAFITSGITSMRTGNLIGISVTPANGKGTINMWADGSKVTLSDSGMDGYTNGDTERTLAEIGGTGKRIVSVGAFVTSHGAGQMFPSDAIGGIATFSSRGPAADGRMKPEITAPGTYIASSLSSYAAAAAGTEASSEVWNGRNYQYGYMEGTSMAAPFVTGVVAAWLQANPAMTPENLRDILAATATCDSFTGASEPLGGTWGYGKINAVEGVRKAIEQASNIGGISAEPQGSHTLTPSAGGWTVTSCGQQSYINITLTDTSGKTLRKITQRNIASGTAIQVPAAGMPRGIYIIKVCCGNGATAHKVVL